MKNYKELQEVILPKSTGVSVNMMPFILGDLNSVPENLRQYDEIIQMCKFGSRKGEVAYLTIDERPVISGLSQRRGGPHTEAGAISFGGAVRGSFGSGLGSLGWGGGSWGGASPDAGLYMLNNQENTCQIWDESVETLGINGHLDAESLNSEPKMVKSNTLYWLHDRTPHEALPSSENYSRQFLRIVSPDIGAWYRKESTENPFGIKPNCPILETKFAA